MLRCWACRAPLRPKLVRRDAILRGRERSRGGPYRLYRCSRCLKENKVEENGRGELFASPPKEIALLDYLFGWIEPLAPEDFLRIHEWRGESGEARRRFFEAGGDRRYSGGPIRRILRRLRGRRPVLSPPSHAGSSGAKPRRPRPATEERPPAQETSRPRGIPHPYKILGLEPGASDEEIRRAFHELARRWHPDKQRDPARLEEATRRWKELLRAYESLRSRHH